MNIIVNKIIANLKKKGVVIKHFLQTHNILGPLLGTSIIVMYLISDRHILTSVNPETVVHYLESVCFKVIITLCIVMAIGTFIQDAKDKKDKTHESKQN